MTDGDDPRHAGPDTTAAASRRAFLATGVVPLGLWTAGLLTGGLPAGRLTGDEPAETGPGLGHAIPPRASGTPGVLAGPHHPPKAKRIVYLCMSGGPSQIETFDEKPALIARRGEELPPSVRRGRLTTMTSGQASYPLVGSAFPFSSHGQSGLRISDLLPHTAARADRLCVIRSMQTEAINHDPGITLLQTGSVRSGRPSLGSWVAYALGAETADLPAFVVLVSGGQPGDQPLFERLWGSAFLPARTTGLRLAPQGDLVPYLADPAGVTAATRRRMLDGLAELTAAGPAGPDGRPAAWDERLANYEAAARMQLAAPELADLSGEDRRTLEAYGPDAATPGSFARHCLLARRCLERGVRFVQLYHRGWDHHDKLPTRIRAKAAETDRATGALLSDLAARGLLDDTLVVWGGEFGRTAFCQGTLTADDYARDHHGRAFSVWLAGGGVRAGHAHGRTDDFSHDVVEDGVPVHDLNATILHLLGLDHLRLTVPHQGREMRLTDVAGRVVTGVIA